MLKLYTTKEICELLGLSIFVLRNWAKKGIGPKCYRTPGGHRRFAEQDVKDWYQTKYVLQKEG